MRQYKRGFTLVEVMVALTVTALLLSVVYASLHASVDSTRRVSEVIVKNDHQRTLTHFMRSQLLQIETRGLDDSQRFSGDVDSFNFSVRYLQEDPALRTFDIELVPANNGMLQLAINETTVGGKNTPVSTVLLTALEELTFQYYGIAGDASRAEWHEGWHPANGLPQLLHVKYQQAPDSSGEMYLAIAGSNPNRPRPNNR